jgi:hypothetical protein
MHPPKRKSLARQPALAAIRRREAARRSTAVAGDASTGAAMPGTSASIGTIHTPR